jgi:hypothetical protein
MKIYIIARSPRCKKSRILICWTSKGKKLKENKQNV